MPRPGHIAPSKPRDAFKRCHRNQSIAGHLGSLGHGNLNLTRAKTRSTFVRSLVYHGCLGWRRRRRHGYLEREGELCLSSSDTARERSATRPAAMTPPPPPVVTAQFHSEGTHSMITVQGAPLIFDPLGRTWQSWLRCARLIVDESSKIQWVTLSPP